ncbi:MAG TPA: helix-turn-helix domain-containing protein, partial [Thermoanaerobaculia bacterium]
MVNARTIEQKTAKADAIAAAALSLQREVRFEDWTVSQVARRAGVAKGTVFLYYDSKEALGLAVAQRLLADWLDDLDRRLSDATATTAGGVAQAVGRSLESRGPLRRTI